MAGNTLGKLFTVTTCGESHGSGYMCIVDGCPPGLELAAEDIQKDLNRRRPGQSHFTTQRREADEVEVIAGVFEGKTTGTSIGLLVRNTDQRSSDYSEIKDQFRPGHADYTYQQKYGIRDYRGGGRASARETLNWVAAGAIAKKYLAKHFNTQIRGYLEELGKIRAETIDFAEINNNPFFCPDKNKVPAMEEYITQLRRDGNSIGARITVEALNVPIGLGEPVFDRLDADLAHGLMAINAVKGVEIGDGFSVIQQLGSEHRDEIDPEGFLTNHAGGILGGISTGQTIRASIALKPTSSIRLPGKSVNVDNQAVDVVTLGRHDPCVGIRAAPIAEAVVAIVLMDHVLRQRAQNG